MGEIKDFKDFTVWKESSRFAVDIYRLCKNFLIVRSMDLLHKCREQR
jgi:hypothetical protein